MFFAGMPGRVPVQKSSLEIDVGSKMHIGHVRGKWNF